MDTITILAMAKFLGLIGKVRIPGTLNTVATRLTGTKI